MRWIVCALSLLGCWPVLASGATVWPSSVTTDMVTRADFVPDNTMNNIANTIDGNSSTGIVTEIATGDVSYSFAPAVSGANGFLIWNNAGFLFDDGESIGKLDISVLDGASAVLFSATDVVVPEGAAGDPFLISFPSTLDGIAKVNLKIKANTNTPFPSMDGVAWRDVALNVVPEPTSLGVVGAIGLLAAVRRRRRC
ncbi:MAG: PEP-CTERM sorting domain-containing protein [Pirellulales bacterium]